MKIYYKMEELVPIVAELSRKYTSGESTSITYEKARQLMRAVQYAILFYQREALKRHLPVTGNMISADEAYREGYRLLCEKIKKTQEIYNELMLDFHSFKNENYEDTVQKGIPAFFLYYDPKFNPIDTVITMDYPVIGNLRNRQGILAIEEYIKKIQLEQEFFRRLPEAYCYESLRNYQKDYQKQFDNLCSIVLRDMITKVCGRENLYRGKTKEELKEMFDSVLHRMIMEKYDGNTQLENYLHQDLDGFAAQIAIINEK